MKNYGSPVESAAAKVEKRIAAERSKMNLAPWQFSPSEVDHRTCPWPASTVAFASWQHAQAQRREILARDPHYFDDDTAA